MKNNPEELLKAGFIPDIYNYCDRWCETCGFRTSCLSYRLEQKAEENEDELPLEQILQNPLPLWDMIRRYLHSEEGVEALQESFPETPWKEEGEEVEEGEEGEEGEEEEVYPDAEYRAGMLDLLRTSLVYEMWAEHSLERACVALDDLAEAERKRADAVTAAVEVVDWQLNVINPKLRQAVYDDYRREKGDADGEWLLEPDGSAKVALLSMEQSERAWRELVDLLPVLAQEVEHLLIVLSELRTEILKQFPVAMEFKRPGFDD